ncbi:histone arginine methyltransferase prmt2 [Cystoisospora suis]|uniref:Histone arginine methyltransferase prmt2 n=1 Tax=Cystoisospora suis TaxID=483139 RepID=A0A2C6L1L0_9APIC|nr:histone arginine methyltransferase prmt2 [Cystoisospora suis]
MARREEGRVKARSRGVGDKKNTVPAWSSFREVSSTPIPTRASVTADSMRSHAGSSTVVRGEKGKEEEESSSDGNTSSSSSSSSSSPSNQSSRGHPSSLQPSDGESPVHSSSSSLSSVRSSPVLVTSSSLVSDSYISSPSPPPPPSSPPLPPPHSSASSSLPASATSSPKTSSLTKQSSSSSSLAYFTSYGDPQVHSYMLRDGPRTSAYHRAVEMNQQFFEDSYVMDVGAGSGILSLFAARTGKAKRVYAVEPSDAFYLLKEIVHVNNLTDVIIPIHTTVENLISLSRRRVSKHLSSCFPEPKEKPPLQNKGQTKKKKTPEDGKAAIKGKEAERQDKNHLKPGKKEKNTRRENLVKKTRFSAEEDSCDFYDPRDGGEDIEEDEASSLEREGVKEFLDEQMSRYMLSGKKSSLYFIDIIISEWMGFYLFHEGMLDSVLKARDAFLRKGEKREGEGRKGRGLMFPSRARLYLSLADCSDYWAKRLRCFTNFHGFNFTPLQHQLQENLHKSKQPLLIHLKPEQCTACDPVLLLDWNLVEVDIKALENISSQVVLRQKRRGPVHAFALWFECEFPSPSSVGRQVSQRERTKKDRGKAADEEKEENSKDDGSADEFRGSEGRMEEKTAENGDSVKKEGPENKEAKDEKGGVRRRKKKRKGAQDRAYCCSGDIDCEDCQNIVREMNEYKGTSNEAQEKPTGGEEGRQGKAEEGAPSSNPITNEKTEENKTNKQDDNQLKKVVLDTSPFSQETHWKQTLVVLPHPPLETTPNLLLSCLVQLKKEHACARSYEVNVEVVEATMAEGDTGIEERTEDDDDDAEEESEEETNKLEDQDEEEEDPDDTSQEEEEAGEENDTDNDDDGTDEEEDGEKQEKDSSSGDGEDDEEESDEDKEEKK